jgi:hypothetical protein
MSSSDVNLTDLVKRKFDKAGISLAAVDIRRFPNETIVIVEVPARDFASALSVASELDTQISDGFVTVRKQLKKENL